jgi:choline-sulfatase
MRYIRRRFFTKALCACIFLAALSTHCGAIDQAQPNIVFIFTDDQGQWAAGPYGNSEIHTPVMDRLAREGMLFTHATTKPVCSPSRAMLLTGQYSHRVGVNDFIQKDYNDGLSPNAPTLGETLQRAGYTTALVGKWHLGQQDKHFPTHYGFDHFMGFNDGGITPLDPTLFVDGTPTLMKGYTDDLLTDDALEFIRRNQAEPFALFLFTRAPHIRYAPAPEEDMAHYTDKTFTVEGAEFVAMEKLQQKYREYYTAVTQVDRNVGRLLTELETLGLDENTIVVFTSDNGYNIGHHGGLEGKGNGSQIDKPLRRPNMWDTSVLVPSIIRWPGVIQPGSVRDELVSSLDFYPTFVDFLGIQNTEQYELDGESLLPLLRGEENVAWRDAIFGVYDMQAYPRYNGSEDSMRMMRTRDWKLVLHLKHPESHELYNLQDDPGELANLFGQPTVHAVQNQLTQRLQTWMRDNDAEVIRQFREP